LFDLSSLARSRISLPHVAGSLARAYSLATMGPAPSNMRQGDKDKDKKEEKKRKYEPPPGPSRVGRKKKRKGQLGPSNAKLPNSMCRARDLTSHGP